MRIPILPAVKTDQALAMAEQAGGHITAQANDGRPTALVVPDITEDQPCPVVHLDARRMPWTGPITPDDGPFGGDAA